MATIREALQDHPDLQGVDWDNPDEVWETVAGDSNGGGEGVEYRQGNIEGDISFTLTWGAWVLSEGHTEGGQWRHTYTVFPNYAAAKAGYIAAIEAKQAEGVEWEPDLCPIFDKLQAAWK